MLEIGHHHSVCTSTKISPLSPSLVVEDTLMLSKIRLSSRREAQEPHKNGSLTSKPEPSRTLSLRNQSRSVTPEQETTSKCGALTVNGGKSSDSLWTCSSMLKVESLKSKRILTRKEQFLVLVLNVTVTTRDSYSSMMIRKRTLRKKVITQNSDSTLENHSQSLPSLQVVELLKLLVAETLFSELRKLAMKLNSSFLITKLRPLSQNSSRTDLLISKVKEDHRTYSSGQPMEDGSKCSDLKLRTLSMKEVRY